MRISRYIPVIIIVITLSISCEKYNVDVVDYNKVGQGLFIVNEGNYGNSNASLSYYEPNSLLINDDVFTKTNGFPLGDQAQSMTIIDSIGFILVTNSSKIMVINTKTFKHIATIRGIDSPRYMLTISNTKAYVSNMYSTSITIINPQTYSVIGFIKVGKPTEQMVKWNKYVFVANWSLGNTIQRINSETDSLIDSLIVSYQPNSLAVDKYNKLWVASDCGWANNKPIPSLTLINATNFSIEKEYKFPNNRISPSHLCINGTKDTIFFLTGGWTNTGEGSNGVYKMSVLDDQLPDIYLIPQGNKLFYGLGVDPVTSNLYISDALDYVQSGWIYRFRANGIPIDSFKTDIIPGYFCFQP